MLKQTVEYTDFDDNKAIETLYFNLTKTELAENMHLEKELQGLQTLLNGDRKNLNTSDITRILDLVKTFMKLSYGVRSEDQKRFIKNEAQWIEFTQTSVYDAFLFGLFEQPERAITFMSGILPKDLRSGAQKAGDEAMLKLATADKLTAPESSVGPTVVAPTPAVEQPTIVSSLPNRKALEDMTPEEFAEWQANRAKAQEQ